MENQEYYFREGCYVTELLNDSDDPAVSVARIRVKPGVTTQWHYLRSTQERYVIIEGQGRAETSQDNQVDLSTGDILNILPDCPQRISNTGSQDLVFLAICTPRFTLECYVEI